MIRMQKARHAERARLGTKPFSNFSHWRGSPDGTILSFAPNPGRPWSNGAAIARSRKKRRKRA